jgi:alanine racemase
MLPGRPNRLQVDLAAIGSNVTALVDFAGRDCKLVAALKANAHGHGLPEVARVVLSAGAAAIAVGDLREALLLRREGVPSPLLLYPGSLFTPEAVGLIEEHKITPTIIDLESATRLSRGAVGIVSAYVKLDVGLERLGTSADQALDLLRSIAKLPRLAVAGIYTHLHVPNQATSESRYLTWQFRRFQEALEALQQDGIDVPVRMAASSAVMWRSRGMNLNAVDPGRLIYGIHPQGQCEVELNLRPAFMALVSQLVQVKITRRADFVAEAQVPLWDGMRLGVIPIGSIDGMPVVHCGEVLVRGRRVPILGESSLEHTRLDLTHAPGASAGDDVVIIGRQGSAEITVDEVIAWRQRPAPNGLAVDVRQSVERAYFDVAPARLAAASSGSGVGEPA